MIILGSVFEGCKYTKLCLPVNIKLSLPCPMGFELTMRKVYVEISVVIRFLNPYGGSVHHISCYKRGLPS